MGVFYSSQFYSVASVLRNVEFDVKKVVSGALVGFVVLYCG